MNDERYAKLLQRLRNQRKLLALSQGEVAEAINVSRVTYTNIESGKRVLTAPELLSLMYLLSFDLNIDSGSKATPPHTHVAAFAAYYLYMLRYFPAPGIPKSKLLRLWFLVDIESMRESGKSLTGLSYHKCHGDISSEYFYFITDWLYSMGWIHIKPREEDQYIYLTRVRVRGITIESTEHVHIIARCAKKWRKSRARDLLIAIRNTEQWRDTNDGGELPLCSPGKLIKIA